MLNKIVKKLFNKEIVLYNVHRQTLPIVTNIKNKEDFIFINSKFIWRIFPLPGRYKLKFSIVYLILSIISPRFIIDINWISKWQSLYKVWTKKHPESKFIVVQHGSYIGGIVTDKVHRYTKCDIFLTWGEYFASKFKHYNSRKKVNVITFGNPIHNNINRNDYSYSNNINNKILIIPSVIFNEGLSYYYDLFKSLKKLGFSVYFKGHNFQGREIKSRGREIYLPKVNNVNIITGNLNNILMKNEYNLIISDHSSALLDAICYKKRVIFFAPEYYKNEYSRNNYSQYLKNLFFHYKEFTIMEDLYNFVSIESQEKLFGDMIYEGDNVLNKYVQNI